MGEPYKGDQIRMHINFDLAGHGPVTEANWQDIENEIVYSVGMRAREAWRNWAYSQGVPPYPARDNVTPIKMVMIVVHIDPERL